MANTITTNTILDSSRNTIIKINIAGDGSGEETDTVLFDASAYTPADTDNKLEAIEYSLAGFAASLAWDATANVPLMTLTQDHHHFTDFPNVGGLDNNAGAGKTGDILISTVGLGATDTGFIILYIKKK